jgi:hypothetical protein
MSIKKHSEIRLKKTILNGITKGGRLVKLETTVDFPDGMTFRKR